MIRSVIASFTMIIIGLYVFSISCASPEDTSSTDTFPEITLRGTQVRDLHSDIVDEDYRLQISLPPGYDKSDDTYPVLYLTDSEGFFGFVRAALRSLQHEKSTPQMIIVGIAYKETGRVAWDNRARDHLPAESEDIPAAGGGDKFLAFIRDELIPYVEANLKADPGDRVFAGMSSGGTLGAYILATEPEIFNRYLIVSPALHSGNEMILDLQKQYAGEHDRLPVKLYTALGELEIDYMHTGWNDFVAILESAEFDGLEMTSEVIDGGTHMDAVYCAYVRGLKAVYDGWR